MPNLMARARVGRLVGVLGFAWAAPMTTAGIVLAATAADPGAAAQGGAEHGGGGLPQLNPDYFTPQLVWLAITFGALYILMSRVALPRVAEVLEERQERIADDLDRAETLRREADKVTAAYEKALADARTQAQQVIAQTVADVNAANSARLAEISAEIAARTKAAEERIAAARQAAIANVRDVAAELAQQMAAKVAGVEVDKRTAESAIAAVTGEGGVAAPIKEPA